MNILKRLQTIASNLTEDDDVEGYVEVGEEHYPQEEQTQSIEEQRQIYQRDRMTPNFPTQPKMEPQKPSKVIGMPGLANGISEVIVIEPHSFEEMPQVIQALRERKSVVLNLNVMDPEEAQRAVDFVAGGTYAMDGHQERVGESIFLFTPSCVKVSTLAGILHDVHEAPETYLRNTSSGNDPWEAEQTRMAQ